MNIKIELISMIFFVFLSLLLSLSYLNAIACTGIGGGGYELNAVKDKPTYFSFTIYNNDADPKTTCDSGIYSVDLSLKDQDIKKIFNYKISENDFLLNDSQTKQIMVTLTPLTDSGTYTVNVLVQMTLPNTGSGSSVRPTTTAQLVITISDSATDNFSNKPEWYTFKEKQTLFKLLYVIVGLVVLIIIGIIIFYFWKNKTKKIKFKTSRFSLK